MQNPDHPSDKKPRLPTNRRAPETRLPGFRLTSRDRAIIRAVYRYRVLTTPQVEALLFRPDQGQPHRTKTSRCRHRLKLLYHHGYLARQELPTRPSEGRKPLIYFLDAGAIPLLAQELDVFPEDIDWKPVYNRLQPQSVDHLLAINDVRIAVDVGAQVTPVRLVRWLDEKTLKSREMRDSVEIVVHQGRRSRATIVPDGYFLLTDNTYDYHHMLEVDMGTETLRSSRYNRRDFARKIRGYLAYWQSGKYTARYQTEAMRVLTVTTSEKRLANLVRVTEGVGGGQQFWFTTFAKVTPADVLTQPIWVVAGEDREHALIW
ncbi:MAG: replication-relaxation family protein [Anaerolineales bacterium]|nr:replication-relaxation family protein [Anaerolineales bacterium]